MEVRNVGACVVRLWSHVVAPMFRKLPCLGRVVLLPLVGVPAALDARPSGSLAGVREVESLQWWLAFQQGPGVSRKRVLLLLLGARAASMVAVFAHAAVGFVLGLRVRLVEVGVFARAKQMLVCCVALLVEHCYTYLWLLSALCWIVVNSGEFLPEFFSVGSGGRLFRACFCQLVCYLKVEVCCCCVGRCVLVGFPERCLGGSGGGLAFVVSVVLLAGEWFVFVLGYRCVAPVVVDLDPVCGPVFGQFAVLLASKFLGCAGRTTCGSLCLALLFPLLPVDCLGWWCIHMAFGVVLCTVATFVAKVALSVVRQALVMACVWVSPLALGSECVQLGLSGCRGIQEGCVLVVVWAAVALRFVSPPLFFGGWSSVAVPAARGGALRSEEEAAEVSVWATPGCSIPVVGLPSNVTTAVRIATSKEASPRSGATL
ncbi:hypothetical protein Taro_050432 [Colocasia esculenta]|uniref:Uncharacterized protein n=1 Tax=Colocasia esculenta TaxID=4460 RepID=A0A843XDY7_COLES|nr:hypothetical protein [Colocasia esculenta]